MARMKQLTIDLESLSDQDWADARAIMAAGGVELAAVDLPSIQANPTSAPVPVLSALIYCAMRKDEPRITPGRCVRLALAVTGQEVARGG